MPTPSDKTDTMPKTKGCSAVAHVASVMTFDSDYKKVIDPVVAATLAVLRSAAKVPSIKRFVLTSSS